MRAKRLLLAFLVGGLALAPAPAVPADERDQGFVEALRREDPAVAERYVALRDARAEAIGELQRAQARFAAMTPELRAPLVAPLRQAERRYAERSIALLEFLDARDRRTLARYQEEIGRLTGILEDRQRARAELERLLRGP